MMQIEKNRGGGFEEGPSPDVRIATYSNGLVGVALVAFVVDVVGRPVCSVAEYPGSGMDCVW